MPLPHPTALLTAALLLPAVAAAQPRWKPIGATSSGNPVFVDPRSVRTANGITTAIVRVRFLKPVPAPNGPWRSSRASAMLDCARHVAATKESTIYKDDAGTQVAQHTVNAQPGYSSPILNTPSDLALKALCPK